MNLFRSQPNQNNDIEEFHDFKRYFNPLTLVAIRILFLVESIKPTIHFSFNIRFTAVVSLISFTEVVSR